MKIIRLPKKISALIFDMDLTLYSNPEYGRIQIDNLVAIAGRKRGLSPEDTAREIETARKAWADSHEGKQRSLSSIILSWGFTMEDNVRWREESYEPEKFLSADTRLSRTLARLSGYALGVVTNNPVSIAKRTLKCLGVGERFCAVVGIDTCMKSKPHRLPFTRIIELFNFMPGHEADPILPETCVSIGDRYEIDLEIPLEMGMGAVLVNGVEDVYTLPELLPGVAPEQSFG